MKTYPNYKPTNIQWIGEIPEHWEVSKLKYLANKVDEAPLSTELLFAVENIESFTGKLVGLEKKLDFEGSISGFKKGDTVFNKLRPYLAKVYHADKNGGYYGELLTIRGKVKIKSRFLYQLLSSSFFIEVVNSSTEGTKMPRANWDSGIKLIELPLPPFSEQEAIVSFLDKKTALIDELIEKKTRKIDLLKEYRTALINNAVTGKISVNSTSQTTFKPSGIEWIGDIPEHWEVKKLKYFARIMNGRDYKEFTVEEGGYPVFGTGGVFARCSKYFYDKPSVLLGRKGSVENPQFVNEPFWTSDTTYYTEIRPDVVPMFFFHLVKQINFKLYIYGSAIPSMTKSVYDEMYFPAPPLFEQKEIVAFLEVKTAEVDKAVDLETEKITQLKEYRQSLISNVVTGKVCVV